MIKSLFEWLNKALSDVKGTPSTKRLGHFLGLLCACLVVCVLTGIVVGLSLNVPTIHYLSVFDSLLSTITWVVGMLVTGGSVSYISTRKGETNGQ